jgi:hypothetical protein
MILWKPDLPKPASAPKKRMFSVPELCQLVNRYLTEELKVQ